MTTYASDGSTISSTIQISMPDDFHHHLRDGIRTKSILSHVTKRFGRALIMPNLKPPITSADAAMEYREHILQSLPSHGSHFVPLMTLYLTDKTTSEDIYKAHATNFIKAVKYYPAGATTNSDYGVTDVRNTYDALKAMEECGMILCIHSEVSDPTVDIFDREGVFIQSIMIPLLRDFTTLKIVMEHISTKEAAEFVQGCDDRVAATITPHHLLYNRNALLVGGIRPHMYCLPILKREKDRLAIVQAAISGNRKFFAGTDSAPHPTTAKESACGCAGIFTAHAAVELYAEVFDKENALDRLESFLSHFGAYFYGLERSVERKITLQRSEWTVPKYYDFGDETVTPLRAGETIHWSIMEK